MMSFHPKNSAIEGVTPCMGCEERRVGCHGECTRYNAWKTAHLMAIDARFDRREEFEDLFRFKRDAITRATKRRN